MSDSNDLGSFFAGFVIGGLVGAAVALMMAPQSGEDTRMMIRDKSYEIRDKAVETSQEALQQAEKSLEDARALANQSMDELRVRIEDLSRAVRETTADVEVVEIEVEEASEAGEAAA